MLRVLTGTSWWSFRLSGRIPHDRLGTITVTDDSTGKPPGGEQAEHSATNRQEATRNTLDAEVGAVISPSLLVKGRPCLFHTAAIGSPEVVLVSSSRSYSGGVV